MNYYSKRWILFTRIAAIVALSISLFGSNAISSVFAACVITGTVYRDYNANGMQDPQEPGVPDITVTAHSATGPVGADATAPNGTYSITVTAANVPDGEQARVEFSDIPDYLRTGPYGGESDTTVTFITCTGAVGGVDLGTANPGQYCNPNAVRLGTPCFVPGDPAQQPAPGGMAALVSFDYAAGAPNGAAPVTTGGPYDQPAYTIEATANEVGAVYGLAYQRSTNTYFMSAFLKRHVGFGPDGPGAVYALDRDGVAPTRVTLLATVGNVGNVARPGADGYIRDENAYAAVGKVSLGDMDITEDDTMLYTVNLNAKTLVRIIIASGATASFAIPNPGCANGQFRPFGVGVYDFQVYVGGTCDASAGGTAADLEAVIYVFNPATNSFNPAPVLREPLDYARRCATGAPACGATQTADWQPWSDTWPVAGGGVKILPQPILADIEFDNGNMILGFRDRMGDMVGNQTYSTIPGDVGLYIGIPAGDILRACGDPQAGWVLESNGSCGGFTTGGAGNNQGPGTVAGEGEFYFEDNNALSPPADRHDEIVMGGIYQLPGSPDTASIVFDPVPNDSELFDAGIAWFSNTGGTRTRSYRIYNGGFGSTTLLGKANGLGSLEATCGPAPLEIGNRVWEDLDRNGRQDPNEMVFAGVTLQLWMDTDGNGTVDTQVGETVTNAAGEYYFNYDAFAGTGTVFFDPNDPNTFYDINNSGDWNPNEPAGILPHTTYEVRVLGGANYGGGGILEDYYATTRNTGVLAFNESTSNSFAKPLAQAGSAFSTDMRDSDGVNPAPAVVVDVGNFPRAVLTTGDFGENDHTWDFGFSLIPPNQPPPTPPPGGGAPVSASITKSVNPPFAMPGDTVTWTITVNNPNTFPLTNVNVTDNMPNEVEITSVSSSSGNVSFNGQTVSFSQATLGPGDTVTITVNTRVRSNVSPPFNISNGATLTASELPNPLTAQANVVSVGQLPGTGETPWWRTPVIVLAAGIVLLTGWWIGRRARR